MSVVITTETAQKIYNALKNMRAANAQGRAMVAPIKTERGIYYVIVTNDEWANNDTEGRMNLIVARVSAGEAGMRTKTEDS